MSGLDTRASSKLTIGCKALDAVESHQKGYLMRVGVRPTAMRTRESQIRNASRGFDFDICVFFNALSVGSVTK